MSILVSPDSTTFHLWALRMPFNFSQPVSSCPQMNNSSHLKVLFQGPNEIMHVKEILVSPRHYNNEITN